jgi:hypothetical protein
MSDRELIIHFLEKAEKRLRSNKRFNDIAVTLAVALVFPVVFKLLDLYFLFRGRTVVTVLGLWAAATIVWIALKLRGKKPAESGRRKYRQQGPAERSAENRVLVH